MNKTAETARAIALTDAVIAAAEGRLTTRGEVDRVVELTRITTGLNADVVAATEIAKVVMPSYYARVTAYVDDPQCAEAYRIAKAIRAAVRAHDAAHSDDGDTARTQRRELARAIAQQATALADGTHTGPEYALVALLKDNIKTLDAWTPDDRT